MNAVSLSGRSVHGPRLWFRDDEPHVELFLRTRTREAQLFGGEASTISNHHVLAAGATALELWAAKPGERLSVRGRLVWTTFPCEPEDCRTFVHLEAQEVERLSPGDGSDVNVVELTARLAQAPQCWHNAVTQAILTPEPATGSRCGSSNHLLVVLALGDAASVLAAREATESVTLAGFLETDAYEPSSNDVLVMAVVMATEVRPAQPLPARAEIAPAHGAACPTREG